MKRSPLAPVSLGRRLIVATIALSVAVLIAQQAHAETDTWTGATNVSWANTGNWSAAAIPTTTGTAYFNSSTYTNSPTVGANATLSELLFDSGNTGGITFGAGALTLTLNASAGTGILMNNGSGAVTTGGAKFALGANQNWTNNSASLLNVAGTINTSTFTLTLNGSGTTTLGGIISGSSVAVTNGNVTMSGVNTFTGTASLSGGILRATTSTGALGAGTLSLGGGELQLANDTGLNFGRATAVSGNTQITSDRLTSGTGVTHTLGTLSIGAQTLTVAGGGNVTTGTAGLTFGVTTLTGNATFNVTNPAGGGISLLTFNNAIGGGANTFTKSGNGTAIFSGAAVANTYTGLTTVAGGELQLNKTAATTAIAGNVTVTGSGSTLKLVQRDQIVDTGTVTLAAGGTFNMNGLAETVAALTITGSAGATTTLDLVGTSGATTANLKLGGATPSLTFGANTQLIGGGNISASTLANPLTLNFSGGQVSGTTIFVGGGAATTTTTFNITSGMGGGIFNVGGSGNLVGTTLAVNLNQTGTMNLGSTILAYSNQSGGRPTILNVTIANTATGMSGGIITPALIANAANPQATTPVDLFNGLQNTLTFTAGGSGFTLSGGVLDARSSVATAGFGAITTNGNNLTISGGTLLGNSLASTTGAITLSSGYLGLRNTGTANFTISGSAGNDGRTITMVSGNTGTFTVASGSANQRIIIANQSNGGTWDMGTLNAGQNYTITNSSGTAPFTSSFASYTIGANSGFNGLVMGTNAIPTLLTMGTNASFFAASSTAAARTYNVGVTGAGNDIVVTSSGNISFGINNTNASNTQIINLNRDKGADTVSLISNGASTSSAINIATNQTGAGNLYVMTKTLTLNSGVTFGGTGSISTDLLPGNSSNDFPLSNFAGNIAGASSAVAIVFNINGTLNGTNTVNLNQDNTAGGGFAIGSTAAVGGTQTWVGYQGAVTSALFSNALTTPANWTNGSVSYTSRGTFGTFEASTSTTSPSGSSNYKFNSISIIAANTSTAGEFKLLNATQNDGGSGKEALYTGSLIFSGGITDSSGGSNLFSLNGQDLYVDRFNNVTGLSGKGVSFVNDAIGSTSNIRAVVTTGDTLVGGSFRVLNGSTLQFTGGDVNNIIFNRASPIGIVADTAAATNGGGAGATPDGRTTLTFSGTAGTVGAFTSFLGSGSATGGNANNTATNTNGTLRISGGSYSTGGYILNPVGTVGLIDTTDGSSDTTLNNITIRGNTASDAGGVGNTTAAPALVVAGTTTIIGNLILADASGAANQATLRVGGVTPGTGVLQSSSNASMLISGTGYTNGTSTVTLAYTTGTVAGTIQGTAIVSGSSITSLELNTATVTGAAIDASTVFGAITGAGTGAGATVAGVFINGATIGTASLSIAGDFTLGATNNLALQSNGTLKVGGNVSIAGVGINVARLVTGVGVGINSASNFTLNGNTGTAAAQTVNITPTVGKFHVGDGSGGVLSGSAAQAILSANLNAAGNVDINGSSSSLNLGGKTLALSGGSTLTVGGMLIGTGTVTGGTTTIGNGATLSPGNSPGLLSFSALNLSGSTSTSTTVLEFLAGATGTSTARGISFDAIDVTGGSGSLTYGGTLKLVFSGSLANFNTYNLFNQAAASTSLDNFGHVSIFSGVTSLGELTYTSGTWSGTYDLGYGSGSQVFSFDKNLGDLSVIPEPSTWALAGLGLGFTLLRLRSRNRRLG